MIYLIANHHNRPPYRSPLFDCTENDQLVFFNGHRSFEYYPPQVDKFLFATCNPTNFDRILRNLSSFREVFLLDKHLETVSPPFPFTSIESVRPYPEPFKCSTGFAAICYFLPAPLTLVDFTFQGWEGHCWTYEKEFCYTYRVNIL